MHEELYGRLDSAVYDTVHGYRDPATRQRGAVALAPRLGMPAGTLSNKANPTMPEHKLGLAESAAVQVAADDFQILHAYAAALRHCAWALPLPSNVGDVDLLDAYAAVNEYCGHKAKAIREALSDHRVTREEVAKIRECFDDEVRAGLELMSRLEALVE